MKKIILIILLLTFLLTSNGVTFSRELKINKITFDGNENIGRKKIMKVIKTNIGDKQDMDNIKNDLQRIMNMGYFQEGKVSLKHYQGGLEVIFKLVENPVINEIKITGNEVYKKEEIINVFGIHKGEVLNFKKIKNGRKKLIEKYQNKGYALATFKKINMPEKGILNIELDIGHINDIVIKGNSKTKDYVIKRQLGIEKGDIIKLSDVQDAYRKLYGLQYFKNIKPDFERVESDKNLANLVINVEEGETGQFNFGAGYSSVESWFAYVNLKEKNLLGRGQNLSLDARVGETNTYSLSFYEPWLFGTENSFGISIYDKRSKGKKDNEENEYDEHRQGGSISLGRPLTEMWDGNIKYKIEKTETNWIDSELEDDESMTSSITFKVDRDTSNHPFNPTGGAIDIFSLESAGGILGGDNEFQKLSADLRRYYPGFRNEHAWALRMKTGFGFGEIPLSEQYYLGGSNTLRGYENNISGNDMLLLNAEYRFPVVDKITGVIFVDSGNAWDTRQEMTLEDLNSSAGLGARMNTPLGQLRLDYGWNETGDGKLHFSIGNTF